MLTKLKRTEGTKRNDLPTSYCETALKQCSVSYQWWLQGAGAGSGVGQGGGGGGGGAGAGTGVGKGQGWGRVWGRGWLQGQGQGWERGWDRGGEGGVAGATFSFPHFYFYPCVVRADVTQLPG